MLLNILSSLHSFQIIPHVFIIYYKHCHGNTLNVVTLVQFLMLKYKNQTLVTFVVVCVMCYHDYTLWNFTSLNTPWMYPSCSFIVGYSSKKYLGVEILKDSWKFIPMKRPIILLIQ